MLMTRAVLPAMLQLERAHICLPQSPAGLTPPAGCTAYVCSRFALRGLYEALWADLLGSSVTVSQVVLNSVADSNFFEGDAEVARPHPYTSQNALIEWFLSS